MFLLEFNSLRKDLPHRLFCCLMFFLFFALSAFLDISSIAFLKLIINL